MVTEQTKHIENIYSVLSGNRAKDGTLPDDRIVESWLRSVQQYHIDPGKPARPQILTQSELKDHQQPLDKFLRIAKAGLESLYQQLSCLNYVVVMTDANGVNIDFLSNKDFSKELKETGVYLGSVWTEEAEGTNGVGTCLALHSPLIVHRDEHFKARHINLSCTVSPIFSPSGQLIAVLDASTTTPHQHKESQFLVLQLAKQTAKLIENAYFVDYFKNKYILKICDCLEFCHVVTENLVALDGDGTILAADKRAWMHLVSRVDETVVGRNISDFCDLSAEELFAAFHSRHNMILPLRLRSDGQQYYAALAQPETPLACTLADPTCGVEEAEISELEAPAGSLTLDLLAGTDPQQVQNVHFAKRVMNKGIPIMLLGETGTGKEAFAQAIHNESNRAKKSFVALNCASIPETLIESELFGYSEGAFTGARQNGMKGKILESDGGTLFLDEIGDMPQQLQTRLLRVLAEKEITPLGGGNPTPVDLHVICATHRNLQDLVAAGSFREDLYYRLNGITLNLPPVRKRSDKVSLIYQAFRVEAGYASTKTTIGEDALEILLAYSWPGNIRQLRNVLRYALALNESGVINAFELPPEIKVRDKSDKPVQEFSDPDNINFKQRSEITERNEIIETLKEHKWNITETAKKLGIGRATIYRKMKKHNIVQPNLR